MNIAPKSEQLLKPYQIYFGIALIFLCLDPHSAFAAAAWEEALQTAVDYMTGSTARLLAILAVAGFGIAAFFGRISWKRAGEIILGIAIVFGAATIVDKFAGG